MSDLTDIAVSLKAGDGKQLRIGREVAAITLYTSPDPPGIGVSGTKGLRTGLVFVKIMEK